jgi:ATP-binding cassette subfamily C (CFTR/MRP) protein 1
MGTDPSTAAPEEARTTDPSMAPKEEENATTSTRWKAGPTPEEAAWLPSRLSFFWARPLFEQASLLYKRGEALEHDDLLPLSQVDAGSNILADFERGWNSYQYPPEKSNKSNKIKSTQDTSNDDIPVTSSLSGGLANEGSTARTSSAIRAVIGRPMVVAGIIKIFNTLLQFAFPLLLNAILKFIEDIQSGRISETDSWDVRYRGYWLSALLFAAMASKAITENAYFHPVYRAGYQARVAISVAVYNKALRLANAERQSTTLGELVNLMQVDAAKLEMFVPQIHVLWDGMFQIVGYMAILYTLIGWPCFAGLALMVLAAPVQGVVMGKLFGLNRQMVKYTDTRVKTTNEALQGIQCVKMYNWEDSFQKAIGKSRDDELNFLKRVANLRGFSRAYMSSLPGLVAVTAFIVYVLSESGGIQASTLFAALVAFDQLRFPLLFYPMALATLAQAKVSAGRIEHFLGMREVGRGEVVGGGKYHRNEEVSTANGTKIAAEITVHDATIYWSDPSIPIQSFDNESITTENSSRDLVNKQEASSLDSTSHSDVEKQSVTPTIQYPKPILKNVSLKVNPGELCAVIGRVASGKSTLCSAILNETILGSGEIELKGSVAYAAQSPWILNATLRDNILFGLPMDKEKYSRVIKVCQLTHDLALLDDGDLTEIGERGINLSGGQKQRVSIARAAYSDADIIILDDPLSALDPEVGKLLFHECIADFMKGKTRLFVTNQLQFLRSCDTIVALGKGQVIEQGTFSELDAVEGGEVKRLLKNSSSGQNDRKVTPKDAEVGNEGSGQAEKEVMETGAGTKPSIKDAAILLTKEERNVGAVSSSTYKKYFQAGGGYLNFGLVLFGFLLAGVNGLINAAWITLWTSDATYEDHSQGFYLGMYAMFALSLGVFTFFRTVLLVRFGIRASQTLHRNLLESILHAPQSFFDTTPIGRILSRFSKDMFSLDVELSDYLDFVIFCALQILISLGTIVFVTPWFAAGLAPLAILYFRFLNYFRNVSRETKRLESISRSPIFAQFSETLGGLSTIRAYGQSTRFMDGFQGKVDHNTRASFCNKTADRWLAVRLELIGAFIAGLAATLASNVAISSSDDDGFTDENFASLAGLSLIFAISVTGLLNFGVRAFAQFEAAMNSCERILYYTENIPQEAPSSSKALEAKAASTANNSTSPSPPSDPSSFAVAAAGGRAATMSSDWPDKGGITLTNLRMRYRSDTNLVLKGLTVSIAGGERVGVVGRTGSGKSSLLLTLLRLVEPSLTDDENENNNAYQAPISIDGVDTLRIGLKELRSKLGIIPQNPVLFSGTIRTNVDPFDEYDDDKVWQALEQCGMKESVENMPGMLSATVSEYGENMSAGMRQLLVLGRVLLKQCRILLLDEATSSVDLETDEEIQRTIRESFPGCTVLTIAHRINTIMDSDKILVMKDGLAEEFASPQELLANESSTFSEIVRHAESQQH